MELSSPASHHIADLVTQGSLLRVGAYDDRPILVAEGQMNGIEVLMLESGEGLD